jgi:response regulator RpfG family c-di-GMP phosphodiesterase
MPKRVLDIGNCDLDHAAIRRMLESSFGAEVVRAHQESDSLQLLRTQPFDLVLVNRKLDADYSDGLPIIERIKADQELAATPCMLITNYPEHQQAAVAAGALSGFGKQELAAAATRHKLAQVLAPATSAAS